MHPSSNDPVESIRLEFQRRQARNPHYSMRAFARSLAVAPGPLSEWLGGKRRLTAKQGARIAERLGWSPEQLTDRIDAQPRARRRAPESPDYQLLASDHFALIADWYHYAILSLIETRAFRPDPKWIARRLGIRTVQARAAWRRLVKVGLIEERDGRWIAAQGRTTTQDEPCEALRKAHLEELELAQRSLDESALTERDFSSMTMAIDPAKLPLAKALIRAFRRRVARALETGDRSEVYLLNVQLFPLSRKEKKNATD